MFELFIGESKGLKEKYDNATQVICSICRHTCMEPTANIFKMSSENGTNSVRWTVCPQSCADGITSIARWMVSF